MLQLGKLQKLLKNLPKTYKKLIKNLPKTSRKPTKNFSKIYQKLLKNLLKRCLGLSWSYLEIFLEKLWKKLLQDGQRYLVFLTRNCDKNCGTFYDFASVILQKKIKKHNWPF